MWGWECWVPGRALHWFEPFLSEPVLSDGPLKKYLRLSWSFPFCWAHRCGEPTLALGIGSNQAYASILICRVWCFIFWFGLYFPKALHDLVLKEDYIYCVIWKYTCRHYSHIRISSQHEHLFLSFFICPVNRFLLLIVKVIVEKLETTWKHTDALRK